MLKLAFLLFFTLLSYSKSNAQSLYDSITICNFLIREDLYIAKWKDTLKAGAYSKYLGKQKTIWLKSAKSEKLMPRILSLTAKIKTNGTEDITECFIPRHSINFYKAGKIVRYLLVCFECEGLRFSDDPVRKFVKSITTREKQIAELKAIFKDFL